MASAMIGNLAVSLTMQTAAFQRGATIAEKRTEQMRGRFAAATTSVKGLGAALGIGLGADALYRITSSAFEMASSLSEAAEQAGLTVEGLQELRLAAEQTGIGADKIEGAMKRLSKSLGDLELGKKSAVAAFAAIGLSADDLRGKRPDEALRLIADALNKLPTAAERVAIGQQLMGRSFSDLLPLINGGSAALDQYAEASRRNGQISTEDAAKLDQLADRWGELKNQVGVATANIIADVIPMAQAIGNALDGTRMAVHNFREGVIQLHSAAVNAISNMVTSIQQWVTGTLSAVWDGALRKIAQVKQAFFDMWTAVTRRSYVPDMVDDIAAQMGRLDEVMVAPALNAVQTVANAFANLAGAIKGGGFWGIVDAVLGIGTQLAGAGAFGKGIQANVNGGIGGGGGFLKPSSNGGGSARTSVQINPSPYFNVVVDGRVAQAAPSIMQGGASIAGAQMARSKKWALA